MSSKTGVLIIGAKGAVSTTLLSAYCAILEGLNFHFAVPSESEELYKSLKLKNLSDFTFGGWDVVNDSYSKSCEIHNVLQLHIIDKIRSRLDGLDIYPAIVVNPDHTLQELLSSSPSPRMQDPEFATTVFTKRPLMELVKSIEYDICEFIDKHHLGKCLVVNLASTDKPAQRAPCHEKFELFEKALSENSLLVTSGMVYAYTALKNRCHFVNFTPSLTVEIPALIEYAQEQKVCIAGSDGKTGQTLYKTAIAPMLKHRGLRLTGWYSTNILGNRDGIILNDPEHCSTKIQSKSKVLKNILGYDDFDHQVHIHYYKPRGDAKEAWDNIDFSGWFNTPMQMKIDWLGDDSILAAPLVADLIRWVDFFSDHGEYGVLSQLSSYFKQPFGTDECDFFKQVQSLKEHVGRSYI